MFEVPLKNKTLIVIHYLQSNKMWFESIPGYWKLYTRDDLVNCLDKLEKNKNYRPYTSKESKNFMARNYNNKNMVNDYIKLAIN